MHINLGLNNNDTNCSKTSYQSNTMETSSSSSSAVVPSGANNSTSTSSCLYDSSNNMASNKVDQTQNNDVYPNQSGMASNKDSGKQIGSETYHSSGKSCFLNQYKFVFHVCRTVIQ